MHKSSGVSDSPDYPDVGFSSGHHSPDYPGLSQLYEDNLRLKAPTEVKGRGLPIFYGFTFWLTWKRLSGSYMRLTSTRRL